MISFHRLVMPIIRERYPIRKRDTPRRHMIPRTNGIPASIHEFPRAHCMHMHTPACICEPLWTMRTLVDNACECSPWAPWHACAHCPRCERVHNAHTCGHCIRMPVVLGTRRVTRRRGVQRPVPRRTALESWCRPSIPCRLPASCASHRSTRLESCRRQGTAGP